MTIKVCTDHFPSGSVARAEVDKAIALFNQVYAADIQITAAETSHRSISQMYPEEPDSNYLDFVDNSTEGFPCHAAGDSTSGSWSLNTCRYNSSNGWNRGGNTDAFNIAINPTGRAYYVDSTHVDSRQDDYPHYQNIAHEFGHAFGIQHTDQWPDHQNMISTMQGNQDMLSAYDVAYLRHFYPGSGSAKVNYAAAPAYRKADSSSEAGYSNDFFDDRQGSARKRNPSELYLTAELPLSGIGVKALTLPERGAVKISQVYIDRVVKPWPRFWASSRPFQKVGWPC